MGFNPDSKPTEDNHSLLQNELPTRNSIQNEFFGHFKGFSLTPMKKAEIEPTRVAPPPPVAPVKTAVVTRSNSGVTSKSLVTRAQSFKQILTGGGPALPPPNPGSTAKPIISSPILENSTCTAKELISPLKHVPIHVPVRAAPEVPRPLSTPEVLLPEEPKGYKSSGITLNRIASFLKKQSPTSSTSLPRNNQVKANKILNKNALKSIEISNPILQTETTNVKTVPANSDEAKAVIMRAQSMRSPSGTPRPNIQTFGSMRVPNGAKRPLSIPSGVRPKNPPPPAPAPVKSDKKLELPNIPGFQKPTGKTSQNQYDDCLNKIAPLAQLSEDLSQDNIYAVIEESPVSPPPEPIKTASSSNESMGLLGEIVSEIQNRNFDSIYSTSTLARKKKEEEARRAKLPTPDSDETYVNTSSLYKSPETPESVYSNMNNAKSSASSTSSGYINPSAVNSPVKNINPLAVNPSVKKPDQPTKLSTFKAATPPKIKTPPSPSKVKTPSNLRTRKPSPSRPRPVSNSPDLVTSCSSKPGTKPDVLTTSKKPTPTAKPSLSKKTGANKTLPTGARVAARSSSNVASLQQKFENRTPTTAKSGKIGKAC